MKRDSQNANGGNSGSRPVRLEVSHVGAPGRLRAPHLRRARRGAAKALGADFVEGPELGRAGQAAPRTTPSFDSED